MNVPGHSVADVVAAVAAGLTTAVEQVHRCAAACARQDLRAFTEMDTAAALAEAEKNDQRAVRGEELPLRGVVLAVKDNIDAVGFATSAGTPALRSHRPHQDAVVVGTLREAGAVVLGKSNMHELAYGVTSNNAVFGRVRHPLRPELIAGGSSGGSAAAVAGVMVTAALGTETGCSVRVPAALCGLVGFRPTVGSYPIDGVVAVSWTRDTIGMLAHSVEDVWILDAAARARPCPGAAAPSGALHGLRLAAPRQPFTQGMSAGPLAAFEARLGALEGAGVQIIKSDLPCGVQESVSACGLTIALYETPRTIDRYLQAHGLPLRFADVAAQVASPDVAHLLKPLAAQGQTEEAYEIALTQRARLDRLLRGYFAQWSLDGLILPSCPVTAPRLFADDHIAVEGRSVPAFPVLVRNSDASSILGWPAISLPAALHDNDGLPFGIDLQFPPDTDNALLAAAHACERLWNNKER